MVMMSFKLTLSTLALSGNDNNISYQNKVGDLTLKQIILNAMLNMTNLEP